MRILPRWSGLQGALLSLLFASTASAVEPLRLYGDEVYYSVERKGKPIGDYRLSFEENETGGFSVDVSMQLQLRVLGLFNYDFSYRAEEHWQGPDRLLAMTVSIDDDGDRRALRFERRADGLYRLGDDSSATRLGDRLLTSNHWHPQLVQQAQLLNTLTGDVSRLDVQLEAEEQLQVGARQVTALRYRLGGDLDDTLSWYDLQGRWLGMEFSARDGSRILVRLQPYTELAQRETP